MPRQSIHSLGKYILDKHYSRHDSITEISDLIIVSFPVNRALEYIEDVLMHFDVTVALLLVTGALDEVSATTTFKKYTR